MDAPPSAVPPSPSSLRHWSVPYPRTRDSSSPIHISHAAPRRFPIHCCPPSRPPPAGPFSASEASHASHTPLPLRYRTTLPPAAVLPPPSRPFPRGVRVPLDRRETGRAGSHAPFYGFSPTSECSPRGFASSSPPLPDDGCTSECRPPLSLIPVALVGPLLKAPETHRDPLPLPPQSTSPIRPSCALFFAAP